MASADPLAGKDATQVKLMEEQCLVVDSNDVVIGVDTKKNTHLMTNINAGLLHRAFSIFLFNSKGELLLQQRAADKITFPLYWTNTVCSHPLYFVAEGEEAVGRAVASISDLAQQPEMVEEGQLGVRRAARRKLEHELGVDQAKIELSDFTFMCRVHYLSASDGVWGEHEIDYILVLQKDVEINPNPNEVAATRYVTPAQLKQLLASAQTGEVKLTPWFQLVSDIDLFTWWENLANLEPFRDESKIITTAK